MNSSWQVNVPTMLFRGLPPPNDNFLRQRILGIGNRNGFDSSPLTWRGQLPWSERRLEPSASFWRLLFGVSSRLGFIVPSSGPFILFRTMMLLHSESLVLSSGKQWGCVIFVSNHPRCFLCIIKNKRLLRCLAVWCNTARTDPPSFVFPAQMGIRKQSLGHVD